MSLTVDRIRQSTRQGLSAIAVAAYVFVLAAALFVAPISVPAASQTANKAVNKAVNKAAGADPLVLESYPDADEKQGASGQQAHGPGQQAESGAPISADHGHNPLASITEEDSSAGTQASAASGAGAGAGQAAPIRLFGTVEFRSPIKNLPRWERVLGSEIKRPTFVPGGLDLDVKNPTVQQHWVALRDRIKGAPLAEKAAEVNKFFNKWPYKTDMEIYSVEDYWATPREFIEKSGDCEDYAISKYYALRELGVPPELLRVAAVKDTIRNLGHAVLVVFMDGDAYVLDNLTNLVLSHRRMTRYAPQFTVNEAFLWRHVVPKATPPPPKK